MLIEHKTPPRPGRAFIVNVFGAGAGGGNPAPIVIDANGMSSNAMREFAARHGHESAFVLPGQDGCDFRFRFFVPKHEMEMCGHATVGATWLLNRLGLLPERTISITTLSGPVQARISAGRASVSQPRGHSRIVDDTRQVLDVVGLRPSDLMDFPILNAATSRIKTLIPVRTLRTLNSLQPDTTRVSAVCDAIGSTGLYPFAVIDGSGGIFAARQFPRASGYPEDAATGIAATALAWSARTQGLTSANVMIVRQGEAMGRPSEITVTLDHDHCWISGHAELMKEIIK
jgi:PhzF family phenazine biosynthesis protein